PDRNRGRQGTTQRTGFDAMNLSARVDQRAAAETGVDREVRLQPAIDLAAFPGAPFAAGRADRTECGTRATLVETPQCEHEIAGTEHRRIAEFGDAEGSGRHAQHREVRPAVSARKRGGNALALGAGTG